MCPPNPRNLLINCLSCIKSDSFVTFTVEEKFVTELENCWYSEKNKQCFILMVLSYEPTWYNLMKHKYTIIICNTYFLWSTHWLKYVEFLSIAFVDLNAFMGDHQLISNFICLGSSPIFDLVFSLLQFTWLSDSSLLYLLDCRCVVLWCDIICDVGGSLPFWGSWRS